MSTLCVLGSSVLTTLIIMSLSWHIFFPMAISQSLSLSALQSCRLAFPAKVVVPASEPAKPAAKPYPAACSAHTNCADQQEDCCPTNAGILMGCCLSGKTSLKWLGIMGRAMPQEGFIVFQIREETRTNMSKIFLYLRESSNMWKAITTPTAR